MHPADITSHPRAAPSRDVRALPLGSSIPILVAFLIILAWVVSLFSDTALSDVTYIDKHSTQQFEFIHLEHGCLSFGFLRQHEIDGHPSGLMITLVSCGCDWWFDARRSDEDSSAREAMIQIPLWALLLPMLALIALQVRRRRRRLQDPVDDDS